MKFTIIRKKPCNFHSCSPQREAWDAATPDKNPDYFMTGNVYVSGEDVYVKWPKHYVGVQSMSVKGGKWEKMQSHLVRFNPNGGGVAGWLDHVGAVAADFRGGPKL